MTHRITTELRHIVATEQRNHDLGHEYITARDGSVVADQAGGLIEPRKWTAADLAAIPLAPAAGWETGPADAEPASDRTTNTAPRRLAPPSLRQWRPF